MSQPVVPKLIGGYEILDRIASGGMAEIFLARTKGYGGFEKRLVVKRLHDEYAEDPAFVRMLVDEARITAQLQHANIVQVTDLGMDGPHVYLAMELVDGRDLYQVLRELHSRELLMPLEAACHVVAETCFGLHFAHTRRDPHTGEPLRIIHRDVSPQNVLLSWHGDVKLGDFGIVKATVRATQTQVGVIKGKFYYMSPEQSRGLDLDHRSDIFSAGIVLYEALTSSPLYDDTDEAALMDRVRNGRVRSPREVRPEIPEALEAICMKALAPRREDRYGSAMELARALNGFVSHRDRSFAKVDLADFLSALFDQSADTAAIGDSMRVPSRAADAGPATDPELRASFEDDPSETGAQPVARQSGSDPTRDLRPVADAAPAGDLNDLTQRRKLGARVPPAAVAPTSSPPAAATAASPAQPEPEAHDATTRMSREHIAELNQKILESMRQRSTHAATPPPVHDVDPVLVPSAGASGDHGGHGPLRESRAATRQDRSASEGRPSRERRVHPKDRLMKVLLAGVTVGIVGVTGAIIWLVTHPVMATASEGAARPSGDPGQRPPRSTTVQPPAASRPSERTPSTAPPAFKEPSTASGVLVVRPPKAGQALRLYIDGELIPDGSEPLRLPPGEHTVWARIQPDGVGTRETVVRIEPGRTVEVTLQPE